MYSRTTWIVVVRTLCLLLYYFAISIFASLFQYFFYSYASFYSTIKIRTMNAINTESVRINTYFKIHPITNSCC